VQATGVRLGMILQAIGTISCGIVIGFIFSWKLTIFILGVMPFIFFAAMMQVKIAKGFSGKNNKNLETAGKVRLYISCKKKTK
jgi:predicted MFS family arabinose efflux permease